MDKVKVIRGTGDRWNCIGEQGVFFIENSIQDFINSNINIAIKHLDIKTSDPSNSNEYTEIIITIIYSQEEE